MSYITGLFYLMVILGPVISISSSSWVLCWAGMEIGFLGLVPLFLMGGSFTSESAMKYFFVQSLASAFLVLGGIMVFVLNSTISLWVGVCMLSLCLKLGVFPGHFWVPTVLFGLSWDMCCVLLGPPKFGPLAFLSLLASKFSSVHELVFFLGAMSALVGALMGMNQTSVRGMLGASSISHTGWLSMGVLFGGFWLYFCLYLITLILGFFYLEQKNWKGISCVLLSMSGLPPFVMFIAKFWVVAQVVSCSSSWFLVIFPLMGALLSLYFYLKFSYSFYLQEGVGSMMMSPFLTTLMLNVGGACWLVCLI